MTIGILGMGTIGGGVFELAQKTAEITVKRVLEKRFQNEYTTENIDDIVNDREIDTVVETMGGLHPAYEFASLALENGKNFVTANKLLVSAYGRELDALARKKGCAFLYGAACGGGMAYLANLARARESDTITALGGILNGTTNYILDSMERSGQSYDEALAVAQQLGYAERDPSSDVDGLDTMRKLVLACGVGFSLDVSTDDIPTAGISRITRDDIAFAQSHGMCVRLTAQASYDGSAFSAFVVPSFCPRVSPEGGITANNNYAWYEGQAYGVMGYSGQGAGRYPTAANVLRDVRAIALGDRYMTRETLTKAAPVNMMECSHYAGGAIRRGTFADLLAASREGFAALVREA